MLQSAKHHHTVYLIDSSNGILKNIDPQDQLCCNQHYNTYDGNNIISIRHKDQVIDDR